MPFSPTPPLLDTVVENFAFSHLITYEDVDPLTLLPVTYPVVLTANETNPNTIVISDNSISGYYFGSFPANIQYKTKNDQYQNITKFEDINVDSLDQMIYYRASTSISKTFTYTANAMDGTNVVATEVYQIVVMNDWTSGLNSLKYYVGLT